MIECLILGDSIAVGTAQARPECVAYATSGINTTQFNKKYPQKFELLTLLRREKFIFSKNS